MRATGGTRCNKRVWADGGQGRRQGGPLRREIVDAQIMTQRNAGNTREIDTLPSARSPPHSLLRAPPTSNRGALRRVAPSNASASSAAVCAAPISTRNPPANRAITVPSTASPGAGTYCPIALPSAPPRSLPRWITRHTHPLPPRIDVHRPDLAPVLAARRARVHAAHLARRDALPGRARARACWSRARCARGGGECAGAEGETRGRGHGDGVPGEDEGHAGRVGAGPREMQLKAGLRDGL